MGAIFVVVPPEVLDRRQRDRVDPVLHHHLAGGRERGDPMGERSHEAAERLRGQRSVDPAVPLGQLRVVVLRAQHDLERPGAAHEAHEVLDAAPAGDQTERRLRLTEDRRLPGGEAHVARQHELAAGAAYATLDLRDTEVVYGLPSWKGDIDILSGDISKLRGLGWSPRVPLEEGLRRMAIDLGWLRGDRQ